MMTCSANQQKVLMCDITNCPGTNRGHSWRNQAVRMQPWKCSSMLCLAFSIRTNSLSNTCKDYKFFLSRTGHKGWSWFGQEPLRKNPWVADICSFKGPLLCIASEARWQSFSCNFLLSRDEVIAFCTIPFYKLHRMKAYVALVLQRPLRWVVDD